MRLKTVTQVVTAGDGWEQNINCVWTKDAKPVAGKPRMSLISASLVFLFCFFSFPNACMPSVLVEPLRDMGWNGMSAQWVSYEFPIWCPDIPDLDCNGWSFSGPNTDDVSVSGYLANWGK